MPPPSASAGRWWSRRRCWSAAAARPAASSWPPRPDEAEQRAREIIGLDIKGVRGADRAGGAGRRHRQGVLPRADPGPRGQGGDHHRQRRGRGRDRGDGPHQPGGDPAPADRPAAGPAGPQRAARRLLPGAAGRAAAGVRIGPARAVRRLHGSRCRPGRDQPAGHHRGGRAAGAGRQDRARRLGPLPPRGPGGDARPERGGALRDRRARGGHQLHQAGRQHRLHGQRRRAGDDDHGPGQAGGRRAGQLPGHRRRGQGGPGGGRVPDHPGRPEREGDPGQHLRRHHPRRRGGARHRRGAQPARARRADGGAHRGHQRRGGQADPGARRT